MTLQNQIETDLVTAMKAGDTEQRDTLRLLKSAFKNTQIELGHNELSDAEVLAVISKEAKKRRESILAYQQANKPELVQAERVELTILERFLPAQLDKAAIRAAVKAYLAAHPSTAAQIGQIIGTLAAQFKNQADMSLVASIVRQELQS